MKAMTVLGAVSADRLGTTLIHEHVLFDFSDYWERPSAASDMWLAEQPLALEHLGRLRYDPFLFKDNLLHGDEALAREELEAFRTRGGATLVDATNASLGRDPFALRRLARATGLHLVMGSGYYTEISLGAAFAARGTSEIAEEIVRDVRDGVGGSGVRAGLIGEIGTGSPITPNEDRSLRGAARAHAETGAPLMVHLDGWGREGHRVLDIVEEEGGNPGRTILCHMNPSWEDRAYQHGLASRGAYIEYDMMGMTYVYPPGKAAPDDVSALKGIAALFAAGHGERVLMSQDVFLKSMLRRYGGLGYTHVFDDLAPLYADAGLGAEELGLVLVENPARVLCYLEDPA